MEGTAMYKPSRVERVRDSVIAAPQQAPGLCSRDYARASTRRDHAQSYSAEGHSLD